MNLYFLDYNRSIYKTMDGRDIGAWPKLFQDTRSVHKQIGVKHLIAYKMDDDSQSDELMQKRVETVLAELGENDILFIPVPFVFFSVRFMQKVIDTTHRIYKAKIVFITWDIVTFRINADDAKDNNGVKRRYTFNKSVEAMFYKQADGIITQTNEEAQALRENFDISGKIIVQGPWAYLSDIKPAPHEKQNTIVFAGTPAKSRYLDKLNQDPTIEYNIYGRVDRNSILESAEYDTSWIDDPSPNFHFFGSLDYSLVEQLIEGAFGLVWDSTSYPYVTGGRGDYMRVSYSHKFSMYAVAGIPPIVWDKSSMADIVTSRKIGWTISDLTEIPNLIHSISSKEYIQTLENLSEFSELINDGYFQKKAIFNMVGAILNEEKHEYSSEYHLDTTWDEV